MKRILSIFSAITILLTSMNLVGYAEAEAYTWYTSGATAGPVQASSYFIPSEAGLYIDQWTSSLFTEVEGGRTTIYLNDGDYSDGKDILFKGTKTANGNAFGITFAPEKDYVEIQFDGEYVFTSLMAGASSASANGYNWSQSVSKVNISYWNNETERWVKAVSEATGRLDSIDTDVVNKYYKKYTFADATLPTNKLRYELVNGATNKSKDIVGIAELIPYGYKVVPEAETYAWDTATDEHSAPISGTYSIGSAVTPKSGTILDASALYDGDYTTVQRIDFTKNTNESRTENHYYEVAFEQTYLIDTVNLGFNKARAGTTIPARSFLDYLDADSGEWVQISKTYDTYYPTDKSGEIKNKMVETMTLDPVRAKAIRYYPGRLAGGQTGGYHLSELIVYGKTTYQGKSKDSYEWNTATIETASPIKATYSFGNETSYFNGTWTNESVNYLDDGSYEYENTCLIATNNGINDTDNETIIDNFYIQIDLGEEYQLDSLLIGTSSLDRYHQKNQLSWYTVEYYDAHLGKWIKTDKYINPAWKFEEYSTDVLYKAAFKDDVSVKNIRTNAVRIYPTKVNSAQYLRIDELIVYGRLAMDVIDVRFNYTSNGGITQNFVAGATAVLPVVTIKNPTEGRYENAKVITAFYMGNSILNVDMTNMEDNSISSYSEALVIPDGTTEVKVFIWDLENGLKALSRTFAHKRIDSRELGDNEVHNLVTTFYEDEGTTRGFSWSSVPEYMNMVIQYADSDDNWEIFKLTKDAIYTEYEGRLYYKVDIENLIPGETYVYRIGDKVEDIWSDYYCFTTQPENIEAFSFIGFTDPQSAVWSGGFEYLDKILDKAMEDVPEAQFMVSLGDLVDTGYSQTQWDMYFDAVEGWAERIPHMAVVGNHDTRGDEDSAGKHFSMQFNNPKNGAGALGDLTAGDVENVCNKGVVNNIEGSVYSFDYGNAHFAVLNSGSDWNENDTIKMLTEQAKWLQTDMNNSNKQWKIVMIHEGMYPAKTERFNTREALLAVVDECGIDLVLQGHDHMVARTYPMYNDSIVETSDSSANNGTVYAILGSAGAKRYADVSDVPEYMNVIYNTDETQPTYSAFYVDDEKILVTTKQLDGTVVDEFTIYE